MTRLVTAAIATSFFLAALGGVARADNWPSFRGPQASGIAEGHAMPTTWNVETGENVRWKTPIPGLAHASPVVWGDRAYVVTAVGEQESPELRVGLYGDIGAAEDDGVHQWWVYALNTADGSVVWKHRLHEGKPAIRRHTKATHANATPATNGDYVVVFLGTEGLFCLDKDGNLVWKKEFGTLDAGYYMIPPMQWGFGNSPVIHGDKVVIKADVQKGSFLAQLALATGEQVWRVERDEVPTWDAPTVFEADGKLQIAVNGYKHIGGYDFATGAELWKITTGGDIPVPTPIVGDGLIYIANAHGSMAPVYAIRPGARGDITLGKDESSNEGIAWVDTRAGAYMQTPIVHDGILYVCKDNGTLTAYDAQTGEQHYRERLTTGGDGFSASGVLADGKIYYTSELGDIYVVQTGPKFKLLATNPLDELTLATPAIAGGTIFFRTRGHLMAIAKTAETPQKAEPASEASEASE